MFNSRKQHRKQLLTRSERLVIKRRNEKERIAKSISRIEPSIRYSDPTDAVTVADIHNCYGRKAAVEINYSGEPNKWYLRG